MTPEEFLALTGTPAAPSTVAPPQAPAPVPEAPLPVPPEAAPGGMSPEEFLALTGTPPGAPSGPQAPTPAPAPSGLMATVGAVASDIGTGITELPRAVLKGGRDAAQETMDFVAELGDGLGTATGIDPVATPTKAPQLPTITAPSSNTGKFAASISQFAIGLIGLGKVIGPVKAVGRAAKIGQQTARAATVGAVAFDPQGPRLADIVESVEGLSNPVSQFLKSDPTDSRATGRMKNAMESIGMDALVIGGLMAGAKAFKALGEFRAGRIGEEDFARAMSEVEEAELRAATRGQPVETPPAGDSLPGLERPPEAPAAVPPTPAAAIEGAGLESTLSRPGAVPGAGPALVAVADADVRSLVASTRADMDALALHGSWDAAVSNGFRLGAGERVQWQKLSQVGTVDEAGATPLAAYIARVADTIEADINAARGGNAKGVMSDDLVDAAMRQRLRLAGEDPVAFVGLVQTAGDNARSAVANYEAAMVVSQRATQDAYGASVRIRAGDLSEWGGDAAAAHGHLKGLLQIVATIGGEAEALKASFGRGLRRSRGQFAIKPEDLAKLNALDGEALATAIAHAGADPMALRKLANPAMWERLQDGAQWLLINNLLSGWKTHAVNAVTNTYMLVFRPMERVIGATILGGESAHQVRAESLKQYAYFRGVLADSFRAAGQAWSAGDSALAPHLAEQFRQGINPAEFRFKPVANLHDVLHNVLLVPAVNIIGVPTRAMGTVDELVKQVVYRSKVSASAHLEATERGLSGADVTDFVKRRLFAAFDDAGRAVDQDALREARTATFSQDLLPGTLGASVQRFTADHKWSRFVLPFVKTPANVLRMGVKMTPGLNLLQAEYREMLKGRMGIEAQSQAVGQMAMGSLFLGTAGWLASEGTITGGGPSDPQLRKRLMETGWQPYSFVSTDEKGRKVYTAFGKYDPVALPFGIMADLVAAGGELGSGEPMSDQLSNAATALAISFAKQLANKSYLQSINQAMDAVLDPDRSMTRFAGQTIANFVPLASALRTHNPDPHMRETRDLLDRAMATIPGLSATLPPRRDVFGEPMIPGGGLYVTNEKDAVDAEVRRMVLEGGVTLGAPSPVVEGADLRDITTKTGRNAYDWYQELAGKPTPKAQPLKQLVGKMMRSPAYQRAPDGEAAVKGTKLFMLAGVIAQYRGAAMKRLRTDPEVRAALAQRAQEVAAHYRKPQPAGRKDGGNKALQDIGAAFGIDLFPTPPK